MRRNTRECPDCGQHISRSNYSRHVGSKACNAYQDRSFSVKEEWKVSDNAYRCPECGDKFSKKGMVGHYAAKHTGRSNDDWDWQASVDAMQRSKQRTGFVNQFEKAKILGLDVPDGPRLVGEDNPMFGRSHSDATKQRISESRKKYLAENPENHPWKERNAFISPPCEYLKEQLRQRDVSFEEEHPVVDGRGFSADIAVLDCRVVIEVNGEQHYERDGSLRPYYQERHDLIEDAGWTVLEIHYTDAFKRRTVDEVVSHTHAGVPGTDNGPDF